MTKDNPQECYTFIPNLIKIKKAKDYATTALLMSFLNGLLGGITCGIYTPTTTTFYVPLEDVSKKQQNKEHKPTIGYMQNKQLLIYKT